MDCGLFDSSGVYSSGIVIRERSEREKRINYAYCCVVYQRRKTLESWGAQRNLPFILEAPMSILNLPKKLRCCVIFVNRITEQRPGAS